MGDGRIHFGSLEEKEKARLEASKAAQDGASTMGSAAIQAAIKAGNINIAGESGRVEVLELTDSSKEAQERQATLLRKLEAEKRKRQLYVPTNPQEVIDTLRSLGQPVTLFGEKVGDRRERLREYLATTELDQEEKQQVEAGLLGAAPQAMLEAAEELAPGPSLLPRGLAVKHEPAKGEEAVPPPAPAPGADHKKELFYTVGKDELKEARRLIADYSFKRASSRLSRLRRRREVLAGTQQSFLTADDMPPDSKDYNRQLGEAYDLMRRLEINQSQMGDERPLAGARVSPRGDIVAVGSWTSLLKLFDLSPRGQLKELATLKGHTERITGIAWQPQQHDEAQDSSIMDVDGPVLSGGKLASASADGTAKLWDVEKQQELMTYTGHAARLALVEFHPSGRFIGTTSWDYTWRFWDVETGTELLLQEGHYRETHALSFQPDGSLAVTGDYAGVGHVWDLRSGKSIWALQGHANKILSADFHPNGYQIATGSAEHVVKMWDLRKKKDFYTLPAHSALISSVRFAPRSGEFLATASFDNLVKIWSTRDWRLLKQLEGHELRVVSVDWTPDERRLVSASHDRTFKLWADAKEF